MRDDFLASAEGAGFGPESDETYVTSLAIDYACGYHIGGPLRWSPVTVELFMAGWLPRKVLADRATFESVPSALDAWVRYAGRRRGIPEWAIERTSASIGDWTDEMLDRVDNQDDRGPSMEFLTGAQDAGIDLGDPEAVATFIAGWNSRSDLAVERPRQRSDLRRCLAKAAHSVQLSYRERPPSVMPDETEPAVDLDWTSSYDSGAPARSSASKPASATSTSCNGWSGSTPTPTLRSLGGRRD